MTRGRRIAAVVGGVAVAGAVVAVGWLGFAGVERTVVAGTQVQVCGAKVGVSSVEPGSTVRVLGASDAELAVGDRARVHALCVVEVVGIDVSASSTDAEAEADGEQTTVRLRWRLW